MFQNCSLRWKIFYNPSHLARHNEAVHYTCPQCNLVTETNEDMFIHSTFHHNAGQRRTIPTPRQPTPPPPRAPPQMVVTTTASVVSVIPCITCGILHPDSDAHTFNYVNENTISDGLLCSISHTPYFDAVILDCCGHSLSRLSVVDLNKFGNTNCPVCRKPRLFNEKNFLANRMAQSCTDSLEVIIINSATSRCIVN